MNNFYYLCFYFKFIKITNLFYYYFIIKFILDFMFRFINNFLHNFKIKIIK